MMKSEKNMLLSKIAATLRRRQFTVPYFVVCLMAMILPAFAMLVVAPLSRAATSTTNISLQEQGDAEQGKLLFEKRCTGCHSLDQDKEGPRLRGVYGRKAGTIPTFNYSAPLKTSGITWNDASLDKWLTDTDAVVPDNDMDFHVAKADERADIIRFLRVVSGK